VANLRGYLENKIAETQEKLAELGMSQSEVDIYKANLGEAVGKLKSLEARAEDKVRSRIGPSTEMVPGKHYDVYWLTARDPDASALGIETDVIKVLKTSTHQALHKRRMDAMLSEAKDVRKAISGSGGKLRDRRLAERYLLDHLAGVRGVRGLNEDSWFANAFETALNKTHLNRLFGSKGAAEIQAWNVSKWARTYMKMNLFRKLYTPRQVIINRTQPMMTTMPWAGSAKTYAEGEVMGSLATAAHLLDKRGIKVPEGALAPWKLAHEIGVLQETEYYLHEVGESGPVALGKVGEWVASPQAVSELNNRIGAAWTFYKDAKAPGFKPREYFKRYMMNPEGKIGTEKYARDYSQAGVKVTQFAYDTASRPVSFVGGGARRIAAQYKNFTVAYLAQLKGAIDTKEPMVFAKLVASGLLLGGIRTATKPLIFYPALATFLLKHGISMPERPGLSYVGEMLDIGAAPVDLTGSTDPYPDPSRMTDAFNVFQPLGDAKAIVDAVSQLASGDTRGAAQTAVKEAWPWGYAMGEGATELARGGVFSSAKRPDVLAERSPWWAASRMLNMSPSPEYTRRDYVTKVRKALSGGQVKLATELIQEADRLYGIKIGKRTLSGLKSSLKEKERKGKINSLGDIFAPR